MAGGGALLRGIDRLVAEETGLPVHIADDPLTAVAEGTGRVLQELAIPQARHRQFQALAFVRRAAQRGRRGLPGAWVTGALTGDDA